MNEPSAAWMFLSICAICFTWYRIATHERKVPPWRERYIVYGKPVQGTAEITTNGKTERFKIIDGYLQ